MATLCDYLGQRHGINDGWAYSGRNKVRISELWEGEERGSFPYYCVSKDLYEGEIKEWVLIAKSRSPIASTGIKKCLLSVVWIPRSVQAQLFEVSEEVFQRLHNELGHDLTRNVCKSTLAGIGTVNPGSAEHSSYYLNMHPKISMTWMRSDASDNMTIVCIVENQKLQVLEDLLNQEFVQRVHRHPGLPALMAAVLFSMEIDKTQNAVKQQVRQVEVRTGHHDWKSRAERPALGDLITLAAKMSGCGTRIGSCTRKQSALADILSFVRELCELDHAGSHDVTYSTHVEAILDTAHTLETRAKSQRTDTEFIKNRIQTQLDALYHLVAQNDALSAQEMAQDCRLLAAASVRDSSSMKCIAIVTMFFLPGTFVSSLLSIPLFDWDADTAEGMYHREHWSPVLVTFTAITFPLMAMTFGIWATWMLSHWIRERKRAGLAKAQLGNQLSSDEARILASKKRSLSENLQH